jgi:hypothetical protein
VSVFQVLAEESPENDQKAANKKIMRMLRRRNLGTYDDARIAILRLLRDDLEGEFSKFQGSKYYCGSPEKSSLEHFRYDDMVADFAERYPSVAKPDIGGIVGFALYYYYLR